MFEGLRQIIIEEPHKYHSPSVEYPKTDLQTLYTEGWWITEIFGSQAVIVKLSKAKRTSKKPYFICVQSHINVDQITPKAAKIIKKIQKQQWNTHKDYLLGNTNESKV